MFKRVDVSCSDECTLQHAESVARKLVLRAPAAPQVMALAALDRTSSGSCMSGRLKGGLRLWLPPTL